MPEIFLKLSKIVIEIRRKLSFFICRMTDCDAFAVNFCTAINFIIDCRWSVSDESVLEQRFILTVQVLLLYFNRDIIPAHAIGCT